MECLLYACPWTYLYLGLPLDISKNSQYLYLVCCRKTSISIYYLFLRPLIYNPKAIVKLNFNLEGMDIKILRGHSNLAILHCSFIKHLLNTYYVPDTRQRNCTSWVTLLFQCKKLQSHLILMKICFHFKKRQTFNSLMQQNQKSGNERKEK